MLMCPAKEKRSTATAGRPHGVRGGLRGRLEPFQGAFHQGERLGADAVVHPAPVAPVVHEPDVAQHLEVEAQPRLGGVEQIGELADAALAGAQALDDAEPGFVGQGMEQPREAGEIRWNGQAVDDAAAFFVPPRCAYTARREFWK